jgi:hypothetical protein
MTIREFQFRWQVRHLHPAAWPGHGRVTKPLRNTVEDAYPSGETQIFLREQR